MGRRSCPACGAPLGIGLRACSACGFDPDPTAVTAVPESAAVPDRGAEARAEPAPDDDPMTDVVEGEVELGGSAHRARRRRRPRPRVPEPVAASGAAHRHPRRRAAAGVLAVVGGLSVAAFAVGRGEQAGSRAAGREAARAATSTTMPAPTTSMALPPAAGVTSFTDLRLGIPLSPVPTGGTVLYGLSVAGQVVRIDLDAGAVQARLLRSPQGEPPGAGFRLIARDGAALLANDDGDLLVVPDGEFSRPTWRGGFGKVFPADRPDEVWRITSDLTGDRLAMLERLDGTPAGPGLPLPPGSVAQGGDRAGGFLFDNYGLRFEAGEEGTPPEEVASTPLLASTAEILVRVACPVPGECEWTVEDRASGAVVGTGEAPLAVVGPGPPAVLSPDSRYLARISGVDGEAALTVIDLERGRGVVLSGELQVDVPPVWTATGNQLLFLSDRGALYRLDAPTTDYEIVCGACFRPLVALDAVAPQAAAAASRTVPQP